jgi:hypothetical protein
MDGLLCKPEAMSARRRVAGTIPESLQCRWMLSDCDDGRIGDAASERVPGGRLPAKLQSSSDLIGWHGHLGEQTSFHHGIG